MHLFWNALKCASTVLECSCCRIHRYVAVPFRVEELVADLLKDEGPDQLAGQTPAETQPWWAQPLVHGGECTAVTCSCAGAAHAVSALLLCAVRIQCLYQRKGERGDHRVHRVATADFWRTFSHEGKISPGWWGWGGRTPTPSHYIYHHQ